MKTVYTIGHSTRSIADFLGLLREHEIEVLYDVRRFPGSKRYPQFGRESLQASLADSGIDYVHAEALGGRRAPLPDSRNTSWRNAQFRGYADHMDSQDFRSALQPLLDNVAARKQVIMCAEAVPWRCHRQLIADALVAAGFEVQHIIQPGKTHRHELNPAARLASNGLLVYGATSAQIDLL